MPGAFVASSAVTLFIKLARLHARNKQAQLEAVPPSGIASPTSSGPAAAVAFPQVVSKMA